MDAPPRLRKAVDTDMLDSLFGYQLRRAQARVFADFMAAMSGDAVTPGQFGVLSLIDGNSGLNQSALAKALGIERSTMVAVISALEDRKLVKRGESSTDKRSYVLSLTAGGRALLKKIRGKVDAHEKAITAKLNDDEKGLLRDLLKKIG